MVFVAEVHCWQDALQQEGCASCNRGALEAEGRRRTLETMPLVILRESPPKGYPATRIESCRHSSSLTCSQSEQGTCSARHLWKQDGGGYIRQHIAQTDSSRL